MQPKLFEINTSKLCKVMLTISLYFFVQATKAQDLFSGLDENPAIINLVSASTPYRDLTMNKEWTEAYFTIQGHSRSFSAIVKIEKKDGKWSSPTVAAFSGKYNDLEPSFSPDGKRLYFVSNRPTPENPNKKDMDIWYVQKTDKGWSDPINLGAPINTSSNEFYPSVALNGSIYFTAQYNRTKGSDIYCGKWEDGKFLEPVALGAEINESTFEINPFILPDESFLIFSAYNRPENIGSADLFISTRGVDGNWQRAIHLPEPINSSSIDYCPFVSPDGKILFFTSARTKIDVGKQYTYDELITVINSLDNGLEKVYGVSFDSVVKAIGNKK
jgi:WD40-like Beta Propeller Repeat